MSAIVKRVLKTHYRAFESIYVRTFRFPYKLKLTHFTYHRSGNLRTEVGGIITLALLSGMKLS